MAAISSTVPKRFSGIGRLTRLGGAGPAAAPRAVSMAPGESALQVILCGASSTASARINPSRPDLEAETWQRLGVPTWVETPEIARVRAKVKIALAAARSALSDGAQQVRGQAQQVTRTTDSYVRDNPWQVVGIAAVVGIVLGVMMTRSSSD